MDQEKLTENNQSQQISRDNYIGYRPSPTLFCDNLNYKYKKDVLKENLLDFFTQYGEVIDIVAQGGEKRKGFAFIIYEYIYFTKNLEMSLVLQQHIDFYNPNYFSEDLFG